MISDRLKIKKKKIKNDNAVDIYVRDCFGTIHVIFPKGEKLLMMFVKEKKK